MQIREDIYTRVTNQIIAAIEVGTTKCRMPWHVTEADCFAPVNVVSKRPYHGINVLVLWTAALNKGYAGGMWATYEQWKSLGAQVRKGERGTSIVLWKTLERTLRIESKNGLLDKEKTQRALIARDFSVFNLAQVDGYQPVSKPKLFEHARIRHAERILLGTGAEIRHGGAVAQYQPDSDMILLPKFEAFREPTGYYSVLAHELTHWTAAAHRLDRNLTGRFGTQSYAAEELIAELGAAFLCAALGLSVDPRPDHADYIASWLAILRNDKKAIFVAASKAQQAADWIFKQTDYDTENAA